MSNIIIKNINKFIITYYNKYYNKITIKHTPPPFPKKRRCIYITKGYRGYLGYGGYPHIPDIPDIPTSLLGQTLPRSAVAPPSLPLALVRRIPL